MLRSERVLPLLLLLTVAANLGGAGASEVALPSLAHGPLRAGSVGYGVLVAAIAVGALVGTLLAGRAQWSRRPAMVASAAFLIEALALGVAPYTHAIVATGAALAVFGMGNGFGNVVSITAFQRWVSPELLGRVMGLLMLAAFGVFPISVALGGIVVNDLGPAWFFPLAAGTLALAVIVALSQRAWRTFGAHEPHEPHEPYEPHEPPSEAADAPATPTGASTGPDPVARG